MNQKKGRAQRLGQSPTGRYETNKNCFDCCLHDGHLGSHAAAFKKNNTFLGQTRYAFSA